ncbi:MAG: glycosyl hydrolase family 28-related protein [Myxococcota bacterium]
MLLLLLACASDDPSAGEPGTNGVDGMNGADGAGGANGADGADGSNGVDGLDGRDGVDGVDGLDGAAGADACVSVLDFGGVGDGVADDTVAIQAAIDSLPTYTAGDIASGGAVCLPAGTWRVTGTVEVPDYVTLRGEGMWGTLVVADPAYEPMSVFAGKRPNAQKNLRFVDLGVSLTDPMSVAFDLKYVTRAIVQRCQIGNPTYAYGVVAAAGTGVYMESGSGLSGYDNRVLDTETYGIATAVHIGPGAHAAVLMRNTFIGGDWAVLIDDEPTDPPTGARVTHNRFEAMNEAFVYAGGQDAVIEDNWMEAYPADTLVAAVVLGGRWNTVGTNYVTLSTTTAAEVLDEGTNNGWASYYTRVLESRVAGDNLEHRIVRMGDDLPRGLSIVGSYVQLGSTVRLESRMATVVSGEAIDPSLAAHVHLDGPATGVTIGTTGVAAGTLLMLTGDGDTVELANGGTADISGSTITLGRGSGSYPGITFIFTGSGRWSEVGRGAERP